MYVRQPRSPCIGVCRIDRDTGWCEGCLRTLDEIADWAMLTVREKDIMLFRLVDRRRERESRGESQ
jgi:predicted Fe-S protein YdhL (DUF1289 family)